MLKKIGLEKIAVSNFIRKHVGWIIAAVVVLLALFSLQVFPVKFLVLRQDPPFLSFKELQILSQNPHPPRWLEKKLERFWRTPLISNEAYYNGVRAHRPVDEKLGPVLTVASWNIEKSFRIPKAIRVLSAGEDFESMIDASKAPPGSDLRATILRQRERLTHADVIVLQEMDIGVKRSGYIDAAGTLAQALKMNYAFGCEQLEIDPVALGLEKIKYESGSEDTEATQHFAVDPDRYKGAFGQAVLSRYPIKRVKVFQLKYQAYDWNNSERKKIGFLENARREGTQVLFENELTREIKAGGRIFF
ncbi:MAG: hypothetical protein PHS88_00720, partial [Candidatus Omnitrophica bacterium]|nr:hypothetical protein [Candidatus Omnitrophota bacterium]